MSKKKINNIKDVFENFDDIIGDNKSPFSNFMSEGNNSKYIKFNASQSIITSGNISLIIAIALLAIAVPAIIELNFYHLKTLANVLKILIIGLGIFLVIRFNKNAPIIAEVFENHITVTQDVPTGGKVNNLLYLIKLMRKKFTKVDIPFKFINSVTRNKGLLSNGIIVISGRDGNNRTFNFPSALTMIEKNDLMKLKEILKEKGVKVVDI